MDCIYGCMDGCMVDERAFPSSVTFVCVHRAEQQVAARTPSLVLCSSGLPDKALVLSGVVQAAHKVTLGRKVSGQNNYQKTKNNPPPYCVNIHHDLVISWCNFSAEPFCSPALIQKPVSPFQVVINLLSSVVSFEQEFLELLVT